MSTLSPNLRKAAVLIRSLDADSAASLLAQLSVEEADALRAAAQALGPIDPEERADVAAEFRRAAPIAAKPAADSVELHLSRQPETDPIAPPPLRPAAAAAKRFEFLEDAPMNALLPYLSREHVQTIAVVLSHLAPARAAAVLAALPQKLQADVIERLALLGDTDPESVVVVERELADWMAKRSIGRSTRPRGSGSVASILAAADAKTRGEIMANLRTNKAVLARRLAIAEPVIHRRAANQSIPARPAIVRDALSTEADRAAAPRRVRRPPKPAPAPLPPLNFDALVELNDRMLAALLRQVEPNVLALALVGSRDGFIDRICGQMPRRAAREFRRRLRQIGPTRLSDVDAAQQTVARIAAQCIAAQRTKPLARAA
ncbi:MAG TPA: FliG C-terminal domain-containing protein [Lacipirellulaceae bacterium]